MTEGKWPDAWKLHYVPYEMVAERANEDSGRTDIAAEDITSLMAGELKRRVHTVQTVGAKPRSTHMALRACCPEEPPRSRADQRHALGDLGREQPASRSRKRKASAAATPDAERPVPKASSSHDTSGGGRRRTDEIKQNERDLAAAREDLAAAREDLARVQLEAGETAETARAAAAAGAANLAAARGALEAQLADMRQPSWRTRSTPRLGQALAGTLENTIPGLPRRLI